MFKVKKEILVKVAGGTLHGVCSVGSFDVPMLYNILSMLDNGKTLRVHHEVYGAFTVTMNPQKNRIIVNGKTSSETHGINEDNVTSFMMNSSCTWYEVITEETDLKEEIVSLYTCVTQVAEFRTDLDNLLSNVVPYSK